MPFVQEVAAQFLNRVKDLYAISNVPQMCTIRTSPCPLTPFRQKRMQNIHSRTLSATMHAVSTIGVPIGAKYSHILHDILTGIG